MRSSTPRCHRPKDPAVAEAGRRVGPQPEQTPGMPGESPCLDRRTAPGTPDGTGRASGLSRNRASTCLDSNEVAHDSPTQRILAVFDWLYRWFSEPNDRGCGFNNSFGELGATSQAVADIAKAHKDAFRRYLAVHVAAADAPTWLTDQLVPSPRAQ